MSQSKKPAETKKDERSDQALPDEALSKVSGGKVTLSDIVVTKPVDKSSPSL